MKIYMALFLFITSFAVEAGTGCLVYEGKRMKIDPTCKCVEKNACAKPVKLKYDTKFFETKKPNNKPVFSAKEKAAFEKYYGLFNQIMELKSVGKGDSPEIKALYFDLDKLNSEISILLHTNQPEVMKNAKKRYTEQSKKRALKRAETDNAIRKFLQSKDGIPLAKSVPQPAVKELKSQVAEKKPVSSPAPVAVVGQNPVASGERFSDDEKKDIVKKLNNENLEIKEDDSLFDIISKTYKGKAYKKLWAPKDLEEPQKTP